MVDVSIIAGIIPLSVGGFIALLINVIIISVILTLTDKVLAHEMSFKNSLIMALVAYLVVPLIISFANISFPFSGYIIPLVIWIALGEVLLKGGRKGKLIAAAVAFVIYLVLMFVGVTGLIAGLIPF